MVVRHALLVAVASTTLALLAGCGEDAEPRRAVGPDELTSHDGVPCPERLPLGEDPGGHGFGTDEPAATAPSLPAPDRAWVCRYTATDAGLGPGGDGVTFRWERDAQPAPVDAAQLAALSEPLGALRPAEQSMMCTSDLGPRWLLALDRGGDLTGVVVDDYGCRAVRLTDDPFATAPGDRGAGGDGTVAGVLSAPPELLAGIKAAAARD